MTDWNKLKVTELKAELKKRSLPQTGNKAALVQRLSEYEATNENEDGAESETVAQGGEESVVAATSSGSQEATPKKPSIIAESNEKPLAETSPLISEAQSEIIQKPAEPETTKSVDMVDAPTQILPRESTTTSEPLEERRDSQVSTSQPLAERGDSQISVDPQEAIEDRQKRKRRSLTPAPSTADIARKRQRHDDEEEVITSKEDAEWVEKHNAVDVGEVNASAEEVSMTGVEQAPTIVDNSKEEVQVESVDASISRSAEQSEVENASQEQPIMSMDVTKSEEPAEMEETSRRQFVHRSLANPEEPAEMEGITQEPPSSSAEETRTRDSRFKDLFNGPKQAPEKVHDEDIPMTEPDRMVSPAIHPATPALYIRDFMRPLNPHNVQSHFAALATPPGRSPDSSIIINFYLDSIRTHALISFTNVSAASRVRSAIHDRIWPDERNRKPLWADFVPAEKVEEWIAEEQANSAGPRSSGRKYEVVYNVDKDNYVTASFQEATGAVPQRTQPSATSRKLSQPIIPPTGPARSIETAPLGPRSDRHLSTTTTSHITPVESLFKRTSAKPLLYWQPVTRDLANKRIDKIEDSTKRNYDRWVGGGEINRYTFEDGDVLVDRGPEIFSGIRPPPGHKGPLGHGPRGGRGGFGRGGGGGGGFAGGRGGYDSWRVGGGRRY